MADSPLTWEELYPRPAGGLGAPAPAPEAFQPLTLEELDSPIATAAAVPGLVDTVDRSMPGLRPPAKPPAQIDPSVLGMAPPKVAPTPAAPRQAEFNPFGGGDVAPGKIAQFANPESARKLNEGRAMAEQQARADAMVDQEGVQRFGPEKWAAIGRDPNARKMVERILVAKAKQLTPPHQVSYDPATREIGPMEAYGGGVVGGITGVPYESMVHATEHVTPTMDPASQEIMGNMEGAGQFAGALAGGPVLEGMSPGMRAAMLALPAGTREGIRGGAEAGLNSYLDTLAMFGAQETGGVLGQALGGNVGAGVGGALGGLAMPIAQGEMPGKQDLLMNMLPLLHAAGAARAERNQAKVDANVNEMGRVAAQHAEALAATQGQQLVGPDLLAGIRASLHEALGDNVPPEALDAIADRGVQIVETQRRADSIDPRAAEMSAKLQAQPLPTQPEMLGVQEGRPDLGIPPVDLINETNGSTRLASETIAPGAEGGRGFIPPPQAEAAPSVNLPDVAPRTAEERLRDLAVSDYLSGKFSAQEVAAKYGLTEPQLMDAMSGFGPAADALKGVEDWQRKGEEQSAANEAARALGQPTVEEPGHMKQGRLTQLRQMLEGMTTRGEDRRVSGEDVPYEGPERRKSEQDRRAEADFNDASDRVNALEHLDKFEKQAYVEMFRDHPDKAASVLDLAEKRNHENVLHAAELAKAQEASAGGAPEPLITISRTAGQKPLEGGKYDGHVYVDITLPDGSVRKGGALVPPDNAPKEGQSAQFPISQLHENIQKQARVAMGMRAEAAKPKGGVPDSLEEMVANAGERGTHGVPNDLSGLEEPQIGGHEHPVEIFHTPDGWMARSASHTLLFDTDTIRTAYGPEESADHVLKEIKRLNPNVDVTHIETPKNYSASKAYDVRKDPRYTGPPEKQPVRPPKRPFHAGRNAGTIEFASTLQRDLYDIAAAWKRKSNDSGTSWTDRVNTLKAKLARTRIAEMSNDDIIRLAMKTREDVLGQMKGLKHGEDRSVQDNVLGRRGDITMFAVPIPGLPQLANALSKFAVEDIFKPIGEVAAFGRETTKLVARLLSPLTGVERNARDAMMKMKGLKDKADYIIHLRTRELEKKFDALSEQDRIDFIDRIKAGGPQALHATAYTPWMKEAADFMRAVDDELHTAVTQYRSLSYLDNHFRVFWKKIPGSPSLTQRIMGKTRPLEGSKGFFKFSEYADSISRGIKAGGVPVSTNPMTLFKMHYADVLRYTTAQRMWKNFQHSGHVEWVKKGQAPPPGFVRFKDIDGAFSPKLRAGVGQWYIEPNIARPLRNYLSQDKIKSTAPGRALGAIKNNWTAVELGLSPFHAFLVGGEAVSSQLGTGLRRFVNLGAANVLRGNVAEGGKQLAKGAGEIASAPAAFVTNARTGGSVKRMLKNRNDFLKATRGQSFLKAFPDADQLIDDLFGGGSKGVSMDEGYRTNWRKSFREAWQGGNPIGAIPRGLMAANEALMHPLFEEYIPRLKAGTFLREYSLRLDEMHDRLATGEVTRGQLARETWNFVEDRFGEMNWDNLWWNRTFGRAAQLGLRSTTWVLGSVRAGGKVPLHQAAEIGGSLKRGRIPLLAPEAAWLSGVALMTAAGATILQTALTGSPPQNAKDLVFPRYDKDDPDARLSMPTYVKEYAHMYHSPTGYATGKLAGIYTKLSEAWYNEDFYGTEVYASNGSRLTKAAQLIKHFLPAPFSGMSAKRVYEETGSLGKAALSTGITKAPGYLAKSKFEEEAGNAIKVRAPRGPHTIEQFEEMKKARALTKRVRKGEDVDKELSAARAAGEMGNTKIASILGRGRKDSKVLLFNQLTAEEALKFWPDLEDAERKLFVPLLKNKIRRKISDNPALGKRLETQARAIGAF